MVIVVQAEQEHRQPRVSRPDLGDDYRARFLLPDWREKRRACIDRQGGKCAGCGREDVPLQGHHISYRRFESRTEEWYDLIAVCADCHPFADRLRKQRKRLRERNVAEVLAWARANGEVGKIYWPDWFAWRHAWMMAHLPGFIAKEKAREEALAVPAGGPAA